MNTPSAVDAHGSLNASQTALCQQRALSSAPATQAVDRHEARARRGRAAARACENKGKGPTPTKGREQLLQTTSKMGRDRLKECAAEVNLAHNAQILSHSDYNPSIDLGFAPYTGATPLKPKPFWRYLGFFFDRKLTFREHVRFYSTKAFSSVQAMRMLGSSTKGLEPHSKRLLYRSCVVPIATYGYRLWYFDGAHCKGSMRLLSQMQRKAALWITGAFSTSPGPGVEALAGLLPIHLLLERMATHSILRAGTFSETHPVRSFLTGHMLGKATPHPLSVQLMTRQQRLGTKGPIMDIVKRLPELTERLEPMASIAQPGHRLRDKFWSRVHFDESLAPLEKEDRSLYLDFISGMFMSDTWGLCIGVDASVFTNPASKKATQAVAAGVLYSQGVEVNRFRWLVGRATAPDAEMSAICRAIGLATKRICEHIAIFTDSIAMAKRALDPSLHSSQSHSLLACKALEAWASG
ncbi:hypothetical protein GALMADRAFT_148700 [Galerina marginata CBS 339.88]|uniref:RNase H type-1 domain-containing protein n=1 Tax=Galerina marginata (strain CBS 339.88) TaxID=685588 RepID=A0A067S6E9_GALM3|nr:hypothetical protein GALMADRAFT_148700 [Galerina marginata CBS 339.88]